MLIESFERRFTAVYGYKPMRLASLAYDAVAIVASLATPENGSGVSDAMLVDPKGLNGPANGMVRMTPDGMSHAHSSPFWK